MTCITGLLRLSLIAISHIILSGMSLDYSFSLDTEPTFFLYIRHIFDKLKSKAK